MKMKVSVLLNIILSTVLLTSIVFNITARTSFSSSAGEYDPWLDYNEDGVIDMADISMNIEAFMTTGNPTKNVTVTNFPRDLNLKILHDTLNVTLAFNKTVEGGDEHIYRQDVSGFKQFTVGVRCISGRTRLTILHIVGGVAAGRYVDDLGQNYWDKDCAITFNVQSEAIAIYIHNQQVDNATYDLGLYATT